MDNSNKYKILIKDTTIFALGSMGSKLILFFLVPLYTNFLTREEYGTADLVFTFSQLIIPVVSLVINEAVIRFGMKKEENKNNVICTALCFLLVSTLISLLITPIIGLYRTINPWKWYLCLYVVFSLFSETERAYIKVKGKNKLFAIISIIQTGILAGTNILLLTVLHTGVSGYLIANIVAVGFSALISLFASGIIKDLNKAKFDFALFKRMIIFSSPLILNNISWWVVHSSDKYMIEIMIGTSVLGLYTAATKIPSLVNVITSVFTQAWGLSTIREKESTNDGSFYSSVFNILTTFTFFSGIIINTIIKPFMHIYVGNEFLSAWKLTPLLITAAVFNSVSSFFGSLYSAFHRTINNMWTTIICAITNFVVNFIFIQIIGVWGAVIGTVISYFVIAHIRMINIRKYVSIDYSLGKYIVSVVILVIQSILVALDIYVYLVSAISIVLYCLMNYKSLKNLYSISRNKLKKAK